MPHPMTITATTERSAHTEDTPERVSLRAIQTIKYDADAVNAAIAAAIGPEPAPGAMNAREWRKQQDRLFNQALDVVRTAAGASAGQTITFEPIHQPVQLA